MTDYAYQKLFVKATKKIYLQHRYETNGNSISWPIGQDFNLEDSTLILNGFRRQCHFRAVFLYQCEHEFAQDR